LRELGIAMELLDRRRAHHVAALERLLNLRASERVPSPRAADLQPGSRPWAARSADLVRVEPGAGAHAARAAPAVSEVNGDAVVGLARENPHRRLDVAAP